MRCRRCSRAGSRSASVTSESDNDINPFQSIQLQPFVDFSSMQSVIVLVPNALMDGIKAAVVLFVAAHRSRSRCSPSTARSGPRASCWWRCSRSRCCAGSVFGAVAGFGTGLLLDTATLGTLGVTSLLLTVAGFWIGRYGETTARDRFHAPFLSVAVVTVLFAFGQVLLQFMLGEPAPGRARRATACRSALLLNLLLTLPVYALVRRLFPPRAARRPRRARCGSLASTNAPGGRFLPGDPRVEEPYRLTPQLAFRIAVLGFLALAIFAALFLRLWALQVLSGDALPRAGERQPRAHAQHPGAARPDPRPERARARRGTCRGRASSCGRPTCRRAGPPSARSCAALSMVTGVSVRDMLAQLREHGSDPLTPDRRAVGAALRPDLLPARARRRRSPASGSPESWLRKYPYQSLAAQVLGYVGQISPQEYKQLKKSGYQPTDSIGQAGIESTLRHLPARARRQGAADGRLARPPEGRRPLQAAAAAGRDAAPDARHRPAARGRAGADATASTSRTRTSTASTPTAARSSRSNPRDGAILAMASNPTYQPSVFSGRTDPSKLDR